MPYKARQFRHIGLNAIIVLGPPCSGKNTYVEEQKNEEDMIIDVDAIYQALTGVSTHERNNLAILKFAYEARDAVIKKIINSGFSPTSKVWIITTVLNPQIKRLLKFNSTEIIKLNPGKEICLERARRLRPAEWLRYIEAWYNNND